MLPILPILFGILAAAGASTLDQRNASCDRETILGITTFVGLRAYVRSILETDREAGLELISDPAVAAHVRKIYYKDMGLPEEDIASRQYQEQMLLEMRQIISRME